MAYVSVTDANGGAIVFSTHHENLLDNGWFTVNQLGVTSKTTSSGTVARFIDRWAVSRYSSGSQVFQWSDAGLTIAPTVISFLTQYYSRPLANGDGVTLGILMSDGTIYSRYTTVGAGLVNVNGTEIRCRVNETYLGIQFSSAWAGGTIRAIKLERGRPCTIADDTFPDYATELLKCQRYLYVVQPMGSNTEAAVGFASNNGTGGQFNIGVSVPAAMAKVPTVSFSGGTYANFYVNVQGVDYACTAAPTISTMSSPNLPVVVGTFNTTSKVFSLAYMKNSGVLILSAEDY